VSGDIGTAEALRRERDAARAERDALAEVMRVINAHPGEPGPVFETILAKAHAVCGADIGALGTMEGGVLRARAVLNYPAETGEEMLRRPMNPAWMDAFASGARHVHVPDGLAPDSPPAWRRWAEESKSGIRTMLGVSMRRDGKVVGLITAHRVGVRPYSDSEIALLESFADQAVIAMENARLITEQREALERQTATAEILRVINTHPGELDPVFETILERAHALCGAEIGALLLYEDGMVRPITTRGYARAPSRPGRPRPPTPYERPVLEGREDLFHMADLTAIDPATDGGLARRMVEINGGRTTIAVPFRKDGQTLGYFSVFRKEVRLFSEAEIALLRSFADQAAIAIENARLLEALRSRTAELAERNDAFRERIDH
jgi:GAF domain-containing protein